MINNIRAIVSFPPLLLAFTCLVITGKLASGKPWRYCIHRTKDIFHQIKRKKGKVKERAIEIPGNEDLSDEDLYLGKIVAIAGQQAGMTRTEVVTSLRRLITLIEGVLAVEEAESMLKTGG